MRRSMPLCVVLLLATSLLFQLPSLGQRASARPTTQRAAASVAFIPPNRAADSYAIYALLVPGAPDDKINPSKDLHWVIADTTVNITDMDPAIPPDGLLKAPPENRKGFQDALGDFEARKYLRYRLQTGDGHLNTGIALAGAQQVSSVRHASSGSDGVVFFSAVYFSPPQTAALVYVNDWCAHLCSAGQWVYLEKHGGHWVRRSGLVHGGG